ncbi:glycosyltransferase [Streptomyces caniscabiei]|uniref:glycosyltransferase n=1 Tax=Streptomyces caniscabiei TaxID=2746961 RepID=UPI0029BD1A04|nr:glycosyltransferase [Streptomyces caniscabiei]MDX2775780.1 glycosyltransferase [Streptomyces caniscabiei]
MKIAMIAPPWLSTYPGCYYGIENVVHNLTSSLTDMGHEVVLFGVSGSTTKASKRYWYHKDDQYQHIHRPWYEALPIISSHILYSLNVIRKAGDFDIIHDHNSFVGPSMMAFADGGLPPILHTLHEPFTDERKVKKGLPDNRMLFEELKYAKRMYFNGVSASQLKGMPKELKRHMVKLVYNGVNLADYVFKKKKQDYFLTLGRVAADKGQSTAVKLSAELGVNYKFAGTIGSVVNTKEQLVKELAEPCDEANNSADFVHFRKKIAPYLKEGQIEYLGAIFGKKKMELIADAKAFLAPIAWEEPFGIAIVDALSCGTPVVAYRRGAFPEIIEHGKNGFLADTEAEFKHYMQRVDEIDPDDCRRSVERKFSAKMMAEAYLNRYEEVIRRVATGA